MKSEKEKVRQAEASGMQEETGKAVFFDDSCEEYKNSGKMTCVEVIAKRTACQKVFENEDHSFTAAVYPCAVHFQEEGEWKEIDNTLEEETIPTVFAAQAEENDNSDREAEEGGWNKKAGGTKVKLFCHSKENKTIRMQRGNAILEWGLQGAAKVQGVLEQKAAPKENVDPMTMTHFMSGVRYADVLPEVDLQCLLAGEDVKDNLILKSKPSTDTFTFLYQAKGCRPVMQDQTVLFFDEKGEAVFEVTAPFMRDAKGAISEALEMELKEGEKNDTWELSVKADKNWTEAEERRYPVIIDPTTSTPVAFDKVYANVVSAKNANLINKQNTYLVLGGRSDVRRAFLRFHLPEIQPGDMVINAQMMVVSVDGDNALRRLHLHRVVQEWEPDHLCWYNKPIYEEQILDTYQYYANEAKALTFGITDLVKDWYENGENFGVLLKSGHETKDMETILLGPGTHEGVDDLRPQIVVTYVSYSGLEGYWTYHSQSVNRAGVAYVNDYNGNLVYVHPVLSMSGNRMPVNMNLVYNNTYHTESIGYGLGFRLNYHQTIQKVKIGETDYYRHIDGDGTAHYFYEDKKKKQWQDEADKELILEIGTTDEAAFTIKSKDNGRWIFNKEGYLVQIKDRNDNTLKVDWNDKKVSKLEDGAGRITTLAYNKEGLLSSVTDPVDRVKGFTYDAKKQLTKITDVDGEEITLSYTSTKGLLNSIKDIDEYQVKYTYTTGTPYRVKRVCEYAGNQPGNALNMVYGNNKTRFTDDRGRVEVYFFNNSGNTVSVRDDKGYAVAWKFNTGEKQVNQLANETKMQIATAQLLQDPCVKSDLGGVWKSSVNKSTVIITEDLDELHPKIGKRCMKMVSSEKEGVGRLYQELEIPKGRSFTFSAYVKMNVTELGNIGGCYLSLYYKDKDGKQQAVNNKRIETTGSGWKLISLPFTLPNDISDNTVTVNVVMRNVKGSVYVDDLQVEWGLTANRHNLVSNGDLTYVNLDRFTKSDSDDGDKIVIIGNETELPVTGLAKVGKAQTSVYKGPGTTYEKLIDVWAGNPVEVLNWVKGSDGATWYRVRTQWEDTESLSNTGYIHGDDIEFFLAGGNGVRTGTLVSDGVTVYVGPGTEYAVEANPPKDTQMVIKDSAKDTSGKEWYHVRFNYDVNWCGGYVPAEKVAENCTNTAWMKPKAKTNVYSTPNAESGIVRYLEAGQAAAIRGEYTDGSKTKWYLIPAFQTTSNGYLIATMGYAKASDFTVVSQPEYVWVNQEKVPEGNGNLNGRVYKIVGDPIRDKKLSQTLKIGGKKGDCYMVNAWGRGRSLPLTRTYRKFGVEVTFIGADGKREVHTSNFGADTQDWQYVSDAVVAKADYAEIEVAYVYCRNINVAYFDGLSLYKEQYGASFTYDDKGNVISVTDADGKSRKFKYDDNDNLVSMTDVKGKEFKYEYDSKKNVTKATSAAKMVYNFTYDSYGNIKEQKQTDAADAASYIKISKTYTADGNYALTSTDALGNKASYEWMTQRGVLNSMTDAKGNQTLYRYDNMKRLTAVSQKVTIDGAEERVRNAYTFTKDQMTSILHNGFTYGFTYDGFGNLEKVDVTGNPLVQYEREERNGKLLKMVYGNGQSIRCVYDDLERIQTTYFRKSTAASEQKCCSYEYDRQSNLSKVTNYLSGKTYQLSYDLLDRLCQVVDEEGNSYEYTYDADNNMVKMYRTVGNAYLSEAYTYDDDGRETKTSLRGFVRSTTYDTLGRVSKQSWNKPAFATTYTYVPGSGGSKSGMIQEMKNGSETLSYTYDENGNITKITDAKGSTTYAYNELNQLIRENNHILKKTVTYCYDVGGNLTSRKEYAYTTAVSLPVTAQKTDNYAYDSKWKDKLVGINGKTLTYDEIGNLTAYDGVTYSWSMGRQLTGVENGKSIQYAYDHTGMRVKKTIDGVTTNYHLAGMLISGETTNGATTWYNYDSNSRLISMVYNHVDYFYVKNVQGDIIGLIDKEGNKVVEYEYDSWGAIVKVSGSMAGSLGKKNPFRYRGYYYDEETGLYYVSSRYYDPEVGRWINADDPEIIDGGNDHILENNLFAYCFNNPVNMTDDTGCWPKWATKIAIGVGAILIGAAVVAATAAVVAVTTAAATATVSVATAFSGAAVAGVKAAAISGAIGAAVGAGTSAVSHRVSTGSWQGIEKAAIKGTVDGFASGFMTGGIMAGGSQVVSSGFRAVAERSMKIKNQVSSGIKIGKNVKVLSPDKLYHDTNGGTLLKIGKTFRLDVNSKSMFHAHFPRPFASKHFPIGIIGAGIYGGLWR